MAGDRFLSTNFALFCHSASSSVGQMLSKRPKKVKPSTRSRSLRPRYRQKLGRRGEDLAVQYLEAQGYRIRERNFRTRLGEIDIVARKGREYFFVEVKTRKNLDHGSPLEAFPFYRVQRLKKMALLYATRKRLMERNLHLSLLGIDLSEENPGITFVKDIEL